MNIRRRLHVAAGVITVSAIAGAAVGLLVASTMLLTRLGHLRPGLLWELAKLGGQTGVALGIVLGPPVILGFLRRVPLTRVARNILFGVTAGGMLGSALSLAFSQPRPAVPLILTGSLVGFAVAAARLWTRFRERHHATAAPS